MFEPYYQDHHAMIYHGDCLEIMKEMSDNSIDTIITDPPYGLKFMGKEWDHGLPGIAFWEEMLRISKPGAILMAFGGTRAHHRLMCAIEDAGWIIRDTIMWVYGSGFPKSLDISKAIDKAAGAERQVIGKHPDPRHLYPNTDITGGSYIGGRPGMRESGIITASATEAAKQWDGWGTALKPAWEPIILAMKPLDGTFAENAQKWGVAGLWIDGGRIPLNDNEDTSRNLSHQQSWKQTSPAGSGSITDDWKKGRWPANLIHDGSEEVVQLFPETKNGAIRPFHKSKGWASAKHEGYYRPCFENYKNMGWDISPSSGSAARFFYCAKASRKERGEENNHPTVKPIALMRYLCRLTKTPNGGGTILDPFMGSGSTLKAAKESCRKSIGIDIELESCKIAAKRLSQEVLNFDV